MAQRFRITEIEAAQGRPGDLPVLGRIAGDHWLPAASRLSERVAERLQAGGK